MEYTKNGNGEAYSASSGTYDSRSVSAKRFYSCAIVVGIVAGVIGVAFHSIVDFALLLHHEMRTFIQPIYLEVAISVVLSMTMALAAAYAVQRFAPEAAGSGVQEIEGTLEDRRPLRWRRVLPTKFIGGVLALSSGLVLGREGPTIHMGASAGQGIAHSLGLPRLEQKALVAAGAAAGLASAFNAPVAAVLFVIEETRRQFPWTFRTYNAVILAAILSGIVTEMIGGVGPDLTLPNMTASSIEQLPAFALLGVMLGLLGIAFNRILIWTMDIVAGWNERRPYLFTLVFSSIVGALLIAFPESTGGGEELIVHLVSSELSVGVLFLLVIVRGLTTFGSYATGVPGGIFAPMLALAASFGLAFAAICSYLFPESDIQGTSIAVAAMGGLFSATVRAPMVGVVLVAELTGAYEALLPILITCGLANLTAHHFKGQPIYELLLERTLRLASGPIQAGPERLPVQLGAKD